jgi:gamma-glutamyltranspeptidase/glutathione hydrolase
MPIGFDRPTGNGLAGRSPIIAHQGMAATSQPLATQIAIDLLKAGGTAVDAAIGANAALGVMEPTGCGIGGDLFAMVWDAEEKRLYGLNASGAAPLKQTRAELKRKVERIPTHGPLSVSTPGCVDGWAALHEQHGRLPLDKILLPAIQYAKGGFPVSEVIAHAWALGAARLANQPGFAKTFLPKGSAPQAGQRFQNPNLAKTLALIAKHGRDGFYAGEVANQINKFCRNIDCALQHIDLAANTPSWVAPTSVNYRGYDVWELPPNGQGLAVLQMLAILEAYDLRDFGHNSAATLHLMIEAKKIAYEDRARFYADPDFVHLPIDEMLSKDYAAKRRIWIDHNQAADSYTPGKLDFAHIERKLQTGDTVYLTTADRSGNVVSLIQSNYRGFGSGLCPDGLGFCLQNRGEMFSLDDNHPNRYEPGKRPFHTIIPAFVTRENKPWLSFGLMGGDMQPQGHVQVLCNLIDFGMNVQEAGDAPRFYHTGSSEPTGENMADGGKLALESGIPLETRTALQKLGHQLHTVSAHAFGGYQAIQIDSQNHCYHGASESRKDGQAAGY